MDCSKAQSLIVPFIQNQLTDEETQSFLQHIEHCNECYDELEVYFIIFSVTRQLDGETQDVSDFKNELMKYISSKHEQINKRKSHHFHKIILLTSAAILTAFLLVGGYVVWQRDINVTAYIKNHLSVLFDVDYGQVKTKSVEQTLDIQYEDFSGFEPLIKNSNDGEQENHEENSTN